MKFSSKHGPIPDSHFDNEVPVKKNPDDCYSKEFIERQASKQEELKAVVEAARKAKVYK